MHINFPTKSYTLFRCYSGMKKNTIYRIVCISQYVALTLQDRSLQIFKINFKYLLTCEEVSE